MAKITLSFTPEMEELIISGKKICTTRQEQKGAIGDTFTVRGSNYRIVDVQPYRMESIAANFYRLEGFSSRKDFVQYWDSLYGYPCHWDSIFLLFPVHFFTLIGGKGDATD